MKARAGVRLHSLEVPLAGNTLLVPSAAVAEVINPIPFSPVPFSQPWLMGVIGWRTLAIPVISLEVLLGVAPPAQTANGKILVFYPMSGRHDWEFYGLLSIAEPRPQALDGSQPVAAESELPDSPYIAAGLKIANRLMLIPDFEELKKIFYP
ncbi:MAG: chemotaxis protein CheW [Gammaproteobacteria bacterium]|nr:chemotaxis protein CheW [Gammaproteobacteria bacterium]